MFDLLIAVPNIKEDVIDSCRLNLESHSLLVIVA
jgi:hypothetical protein